MFGTFAVMLVARVALGQDVTHPTMCGPDFDLGTESREWAALVPGTAFPMGTQRCGNFVVRMPPVAYDGQLLVVQIRRDGPCDGNVQVIWQDRFFDALAVDDDWLHALVPVPLGIKPGLHKLGVGCVHEGTVFDVAVLQKEYPESHLTVAPKFTGTPPARVSGEQAAIDAAFKIATPQRLWHDAFIKPTPGVTTSPFGVRRTFNGRVKSRHMGLDFDGLTGTPLHASNDGIVALATSNFFYVGNAVLLDHGEHLFTLYFHMSRLDVKTGDHVTRGQVLGLLGKTGRATGPHLHFAVKLAGHYIDPMSLLSYDPHAPTVVGSTPKPATADFWDAPTTAH